MGFDLYGLNPKINKEHSKAFKAILDKYGNEDGEYLDWSLQIPQNVKDKYFELKNEHEENNPGFYFRNNVWWWRPLWNYVCDTCSWILDDEDMERGHDNGGHEISEEKADAIANTLFALVESKEAAKYEVKYMTKLKNLPLETCGYCKGTGRRNDENVKGRCNVCNTEYTREQKIPIGKVKSFECSYPFDADNVKEFAKFCKESGGFEIC